MLPLLEWVLLTIALVYWVTESMIFALPRMALTRWVLHKSQFVGFLYCAKCIGFWAGVLLYIFGIAPFARVEESPSVFAVIFDATAHGLMAMAVAKLYDAWTGQASSLVYLHENPPEPPTIEDTSDATQE